MLEAFYNIEAEKSVLGYIIRERVPDDAATIMRMIKPAYFSKQEYADIAEAMQYALHEKGLKRVKIADIPEILPKIFDKDRAHAAEMALLEINSNYSTSFLAIEKEHVRELEEKTRRRSTHSALNNAITALIEGKTDTNEVIANVRDFFQTETDTGHSTVSIHDAIADAYAMLEAKHLGKIRTIPTGINQLDSRIGGGLYSGELTIIGARPSVGKSALGLNIAISADKHGYKVVYVSREMNSTQIGNRMLQYYSGISERNVKKGSISQEQWDAINDALIACGAMNITVLTATKSIEDLYIEVQAMYERKEIDLLIVDYLQIMDTHKKFNKEYDAVTYISRRLKDMTLDFNIPIVALAQVNRDADDAMPTLATLKGSGSIEQDADNVIFIHRPSKSNDGILSTMGMTFDQIIELNNKGISYNVFNIAKQRQGETGFIEQLFEGQKMRYSAIERRR